VEINDFRTSSSGKQRQFGKLKISGDYLFEVSIRAVIVMSLPGQKDQVKTDRKQTEQSSLESLE
jgi:hypothetical protein